MDGEWSLVYANVEAFRSSPFFWGFQKMLPGGEELANSMFKFTAGLPVAGTRGPFGVISQTMSLETEELASEVEMKIFDPFFGLASGVGGTVVSTANVKVKGGEDGPGDVLLVTPRTTRVRNSNVGGALLDQLVVPTSELMSQASGGAAVEAEATVTYVDDSLRIMRVGEKMDRSCVHRPRARWTSERRGRGGGRATRTTHEGPSAKEDAGRRLHPLSGLIRRFVSARGGEHDAERGVTTPIT